MKTIKRYFETQDAAIQTAKRRASTRYRTQYIYRTEAGAFYLRELLEENARPPISKVLYDGTVVSLSS